MLVIWCNHVVNKNAIGPGNSTFNVQLMRNYCVCIEARTIRKYFSISWFIMWQWWHLKDVKTIRYAWCKFSYWKICRWPIIRKFTCAKRQRRLSYKEWHDLFTIKKISAIKCAHSFSYTTFSYKNLLFL